MPVFNNVAYTRQFLDTVLAVTPPDETIIVDNGSTDETPTYLAELASDNPSVKVITHQRNMGFGYAMNRGLEISTGDVLVLANNDIAVISADWLDEIVHAVGQNPKALYGPMLIPNNAWTLQANGEFCVYLAGWCLAFHRQFLSDVGMYDERFTNYWEDVCLSVRALHAGYQLVELLDLGLFHYGGITGRLIDFQGQCAESKRKFAAKYGIDFMHKEWLTCGYPR